MHADTIEDLMGYVKIKFQSGPVGNEGVNGTQIENVLQILVERLISFQEGEFNCRENALAITKIEEAIHWLQARTEKRVLQGVEGKNLPHV